MQCKKDILIVYKTIFLNLLKEDKTTYVPQWQTVLHVQMQLKHNRNE